MACTLTCAANAVCTKLTEGISCVCNEGFAGNGYTQCEVQAFDENSIYLFVIILIVLLFVGLLIIVIYFLCRRRILEGGDEEPLKISIDDTYDRKWDMVLHEQSHVPPDYYEIKDEIEPPTTTTFFMETQVSPEVEEEERVIVEDEVQGEDEGDEVDVAAIGIGFDNPTYDTVEIDEKDGGEDIYDNPPVIQDVSISGSDSIPESITVVNTLPEPELEVAAEAELPVVEAAAAADAEQIKISFQENEDAPNTITATVTTPGTNLTINLNINVPEGEAAE